jgi:glucans biosynthesis protein C
VDTAAVPAISRTDAPPQVGARPEAAPTRLYYLDYLRAGVVALVMLHHTAITYGAAGSWYYHDPATSLLLRALLTLFVAVNQAWFMAFLFFLSGYLSLPSYTRKGANRYVVDRLRRFGIPLIVYLFAISPVVTWLALAAHPGVHPSLLLYWRTQYLSLRTFDAGPLWFVEALLVMDILFVVWARWLSRVDLGARIARAFPSRSALIAFAIGLGLASFVVRLGMPAGATFFSLQIAYFPSYVAMFVLGLLAWRYRWLDAIPDSAYRFAQRALVVALVLVVAVLLEDAVGSVGGAASNVSSSFGGMNLHALLYAMWEPWVLVSVSILLLRWAQRALNRPSPLWQGWASASYVAYIIQPLVLVPLAIGLQASPWPAVAKFALVSVLAVAVTYTMARALRLLPPVRKALT